MILTALTILGSAITLLVVLGGRTAGAARRIGSIPAVLTVIILTLSFQVTHFIEHLAQLGFWLAHPSKAPWLTPWAASAAKSLANSSLGVEMLHLIGNLIFFAGLVVLWNTVKRDFHRSAPARTSLLIQALHVTEHVLLTASVAVTGSPIGVSTLFGLLTPGPGAWTYRIWLHFLVNLAATYLAVRAVACIVDDEPKSLDRARALASA